MGLVIGSTGVRSRLRICIPNKGAPQAVRHSTIRAKRTFNSASLSIPPLGAMDSGPSCYAAYSAGTGRINSGLKNRLPRAAKMIGVKPITAA
jgi:hypothetical protein